MKKVMTILAALVMAGSMLATTQAEARGKGGCGSHGGPGYRKANGKCASWKD